MHLTQFIRDRADVELERLTREGTLWDSDLGERGPNASYQEEGACLLCNAFDLRDYDAYMQAHYHFAEVERVYMRLAIRCGEAETGALIARLARRELGRRAIAAACAALRSSEVEAETEKVS